MLTLMRGEGESIMLQHSDGQIEVFVAKIKEKRTNICIDAPNSVGTVRKELLCREDHSKASRDKPDSALGRFKES